jgi:hypothetical protein
MSKIDCCIRHAIKIGYRVSNCGKFVFGARGKEVTQRLAGNPKRKYPSVSIANPTTKVSTPIAVHRIVAYLKFKEDSMAENVVVRHLNDDPLDNSWDNIGLGSQVDNALDRPKIDRRKHAQLAGRSNSNSDEFWDEVSGLHERGMSYSDLSAKYGLSKSTLSYRLSKRAKRTIQDLIS